MITVAVWHFLIVAKWQSGDVAYFEVWCAFAVFNILDACYIWWFGKKCLPLHVIKK